MKFKGKSASDIPCHIIIDGKYLEDKDQNDTTGVLGGFKMYAKKGRIVCSQTIDDRVDLCFAAAIPAIRHMTFPSMRRPEKTKDIVSMNWWDITNIMLSLSYDFIQKRHI